MAPIFELANGNPMQNLPNKNDCRKILRSVVQITKENSREKLPRINYENNRQRGSSNVVSTESPTSRHDIRNTSRNRKTKVIKGATK